MCGFERPSLTSEGAERMGVVPLMRQGNYLLRSTPSVAVAFKVACQSWLWSGTRYLSPHHCPGSLVSHISESTRADLFSGRALRPLRDGAAASCATSPSRVFTALATHTLVLIACVMAGAQVLCSLCAFVCSWMKKDLAQRLMCRTRSFYWCSKLWPEVENDLIPQFFII